MILNLNLIAVLVLILLPLAAALAMDGNPSARQPDSLLKVGDPAPDFKAYTDEGEVWNSSDRGDGILVVFFYPAAMTGGCTAQACSFRDNRTRLIELGADVVGVSGDEVSNLALFRRANNLNFPLLSDEDGSIAKAFGVPVREGGTITREVDGEEFVLTRNVTTARWTFIIGKDGKIAYIDSEVSAATDSQSVIAALKEMQ